MDALVNHIFGDEDAVNPFESEQLVLCSLDFLKKSQKAQDDALKAHWDLMIVDEAHHLAWSPEEVSPEYRIVEELSPALADSNARAGGYRQSLCPPAASRPGPFP